MGKKFSAIVWCLLTVVIAMQGFSGYSSGEYVMEWLGIRLSKGGFTILILVFLVIDILTLINAFTSDKRMATQQQQKKEEFQQTIQNEQLAAPCLIMLHRPSNILGAAIGLKVFLNYEDLGVLKNGKTIQFYTHFKYNVLTGESNNNGPVREPFQFEAIPGGTLYINYKPSKNIFLWGENVNM